jgi:hypothetical protein
MIMYNEILSYSDIMLRLLPSPPGLKPYLIGCLGGKVTLQRYVTDVPSILQEICDRFTFLPIL